MTTANDNTLAATVLAEALYTDMTRRGRFAGSTSRRPRPSCTVFASFATGLSAQDKAVVAASQRPATIGALNEPSGTPAWRTIPSWYLIGSKDRIIPPSAERAMAERAGSTIAEYNAGHLGLMSDPKTVTQGIERAARASVH